MSVPIPTRSAHRTRRPLVGMLLHQDASTHCWLPGGHKHDLVVTMEGTTSALCSIFLVDEEGTASSLRGVREVVEEHGLFCSLYIDRASRYLMTPEAGVVTEAVNPAKHPNELTLAGRGDRNDLGVL